ncbi:hypothetical protein ACHAWF_010636 [Thalassiosira exigua]
MSKQKASPPSMTDRADPKLRGVHRAGIQASISPSSWAACVDCARPIAKGEARRGIRYAGNPLAEIRGGVIPLYGSHPMVMWCHNTCDLLGYLRQDQIEGCDAARTCHVCSDSPDCPEPGQQGDRGPRIKLLCGGRAKGDKIRSHAFHIK